MTRRLTLAVVLAGFTAVPLQAVAQTIPDDHRRVIVVTGDGKVDAAPDAAVLTMGAEATGENAREALDKNNAAMARIIDAFLADGISREDIQTSNFQIVPEYRQRRRSDNSDYLAPEIVGYRVSNQVTVRVKDLDNLGQAIDRSVMFGANTGGGITFYNEEPETFVDQARDEAIAEARSKAERMSAAAGVKLGPLLMLTEHSGGDHPVPMRMAAEMAYGDSSASAVPVMGGENSYSATVTLTYEIAE